MDKSLQNLYKNDQNNKKLRLRKTIDNLFIGTLNLMKNSKIYVAFFVVCVLMQRKFVKHYLELIYVKNIIIYEFWKAYI